ncbi:MAG TPA: AAA family ATPase [Pirellulales bacterium]|jgi:general secretion pathway protein A|nr:AAA family ATPase [Pirellulales bacterium]
MLRNHWKLRESPFRGTLDGRRFFRSPIHEEALARLHFLVEERRRLGLLLGSSGCGKSLVLDVFSRRLRRSGAQLANVNLLGIDLHEFLWLTAAELGINPDRRDDPFRLWRGILDRLAENRYQQLDTVLLLDNADEAANGMLDHLVRLSQTENIAGGRLTMVLVATTTAPGNSAVRLSPRLLELAELRIDLEAWEPTDTVQYIIETLAQAGSESPIFTDEALQHLHDLTRGIPRCVDQLANLALLAGAGRELAQIDVDIVNSVYHELGAVDAVA